MNRLVGCVTRKWETLGEAGRREKRGPEKGAPGEFPHKGEQPFDADEMELAVKVRLVKLHARSGLERSWTEERQNLHPSIETRR